MTRFSCFALLLAALAMPAMSSSPVDLEREIPVTTWQAPPFWSPPNSSVKGSLAAKDSVQALADLTTPMPFVAVTPCRIVNTRRVTTGEFDAPALVALTERTFTLPNGPCPGLPANVAAWSLNITVVPAGLATYGGYLSVYPAGGARPIVSTLNFVAGPTVPPIANAAIVPAGPGGAITVFPSDATHILIDVNGYYIQGGIVNGIQSGATTFTGTVALSAGDNVTITPGANELVIATSVPQGPAGPKGDPGPAGPTGATGAEGASGPQGPSGAAGAPGANGLDGKTVLNGIVDPTTEGADGDFYINTSSSRVFGPRVAGTWPAGVNLVGSTGETGAIGPQGEKGVAGPIGPMGPTGSTGPRGVTGPAGPRGPGVTWIEVTVSSVQAEAGFAYLANSFSEVHIALPVAPQVLDVFRVAGAGAGGWRVNQGPGQRIISGMLRPWAGGAYIQNMRAVASSWDGTRMSVGSYTSGRSTSTNGGKTWSAPAGPNANGMASSWDGANLALCNNNDPLYYSSDSGATWRAAGPGGWAVAMSSDGTKLVVAGGSTSSSSIHTSADSGKTWATRIGVSQPKTVASSADGTRLIAADFNGRVYTSEDSGNSWQFRRIAGSDASVASSCDGRVLLASGVLSTDYGVTWRAVPGGVVTTSCDGSILAAATSGSQINVSFNSGQTWQPTGTARTWTGMLWSPDGSKLLATDQGNAYVFSRETTPGALDSLLGDADSAVELQYIGSGAFRILSHEGTLAFQ